MSSQATPDMMAAAPPAAQPQPPPAAQGPGPSKPASVPNSRKGYKLTLWVSDSDADGRASVLGMLGLNGADPVPFCRLEGVTNPLVRAFQEALPAVERARARPPRMPAAASQVGQGAPSTPRTAGATSPAATGGADRGRTAPHVGAAPGPLAAPSAAHPASVRPTGADQPPLF